MRGSKKTHDMKAKQGKGGIIFQKGTLTPRADQTQIPLIESLNKGNRQDQKYEVLQSEQHSPKNEKYHSPACLETIHEEWFSIKRKVMQQKHTTPISPCGGLFSILPANQNMRSQENTQLINHIVPRPGRLSMKGVISTRIPQSSFESEQVTLSQHDGQTIKQEINSKISDMTIGDQNADQNTQKSQRKQLATLKSIKVTEMNLELPDPQTPQISFNSPILSSQAKKNQQNFLKAEVSKNGSPSKAKKVNKKRDLVFKESSQTNPLHYNQYNDMYIESNSPSDASLHRQKMQGLTTDKKLSEVESPDIGDVNRLSKKEKEKDSYLRLMEQTEMTDDPQRELGRNETLFFDVIDNAEIRMSIENKLKQNYANPQHSNTNPEGNITPKREDQQQNQTFFVFERGEITITKDETTDLLQENYDLKELNDLDLNQQSNKKLKKELSKGHLRLSTVNLMNESYTLPQADDSANQSSHNKNKNNRSGQKLKPSRLSSHSLKAQDKAKPVGQNSKRDLLGKIPPQNGNRSNQNSLGQLSKQESEQKTFDAIKANSMILHVNLKKRDSSNKVKQSKPSLNQKQTQAESKEGKNTEMVNQGIQAFQTPKSNFTNQMMENMHEFMQQIKFNPTSFQQSQDQEMDDDLMQRINTLKLQSAESSPSKFDYESPLLRSFDHQRAGSKMASSQVKNSLTFMSIQDIGSPIQIGKQIVENTKEEKLVNKHVDFEHDKDITLHVKREPNDQDIDIIHKSIEQKADAKKSQQQPQMFEVVGQKRFENDLLPQNSENLKTKNAPSNKKFRKIVLFKDKHAASKNSTFHNQLTLEQQDSINNSKNSQVMFRPLQSSKFLPQEDIFDSKPDPLVLLAKSQSTAVNQPNSKQTKFWQKTQRNKVSHKSKEQQGTQQQLAILPQDLSVAYLALMSENSPLTGRDLQKQTTENAHQPKQQLQNQQYKRSPSGTQESFNSTSLMQNGVKLQYNGEMLSQDEIDKTEILSGISTLRQSQQMTYSKAKIRYQKSSLESNKKESDQLSLERSQTLLLQKSQFGKQQSKDHQEFPNVSKFQQDSDNVYTDIDGQIWIKENQVSMYKTQFPPMKDGKKSKPYKVLTNMDIDNIIGEEYVIPVTAQERIPNQKIKIDNVIVLRGSGQTEDSLSQNQQLLLSETAQSIDHKSKTSTASMYSDNPELNFYYAILGAMRTKHKDATSQKHLEYMKKTYVNYFNAKKDENQSAYIREKFEKLLNNSPLENLKRNCLVSLEDDNKQPKKRSHTYDKSERDAYLEYKIAAIRNEGGLSKLPKKLRNLCPITRHKSKQNIEKALKRYDQIMEQNRKEFEKVDQQEQFTPEKQDVQKLNQSIQSSEFQIKPIFQSKFGEHTGLFNKQQRQDYARLTKSLDFNGSGLISRSPIICRDQVSKSIDYDQNQNVNFNTSLKQAAGFYTQLAPYSQDNLNHINEHSQSVIYKENLTSCKDFLKQSIHQRNLLIFGQDQFLEKIPVEILDQRHNKRLDEIREKIKNPNERNEMLQKSLFFRKHNNRSTKVKALRTTEIYKQIVTDKSIPDLCLYQMEDPKKNLAASLLEKEGNKKLHMSEWKKMSIMLPIVNTSRRNHILQTSESLCSKNIQTQRFINLSPDLQFEKEKTTRNLSQLQSSSQQSPNGKDRMIILENRHLDSQQKNQQDQELCVAEQSDFNKSTLEQQIQGVEFTNSSFDFEPSPKHFQNSVLKKLTTTDIGDFSSQSVVDQTNPKNPSARQTQVDLSQTSPLFLTKAKSPVQLKLLQERKEVQFFQHNRAYEQSRNKGKILDLILNHKEPKFKESALDMLSYAPRSDRSQPCHVLSNPKNGRKKVNAMDSTGFMNQSYLQEQRERKLEELRKEKQRKRQFDYVMDCVADLAAFDEQ